MKIKNDIENQSCEKPVDNTKQKFLVGVKARFNMLSILHQKKLSKNLKKQDHNDLKDTKETNM